MSDHHHPVSSTTKLQRKLGSLYCRIHQLHNEQQHNIYPPFNNYDQYHVYCTKRLTRLRHCSYKMMITSNDDDVERTTATTSTTTAVVVVKSLLLHSSKYANAIPAIKAPVKTTGSDAVTAIATSPVAATSGTTSSSVTTTSKLTTSKRSGGSNSKYAYHSRSVVYENIALLHLQQTQQQQQEEETEGTPGTETMTTTTTSDINNNLDLYKHENVIWNLFYQSERAWAQACALLQPYKQQQPSQQESSFSNRTGTNEHVYKKKLSNHRHVQNRFNKAVYWSKMLHNTARALFVEPSTSTGSDDDTTVNHKHSFVKECYAYMKWMEGNAALEHKNYALAYQNYSHAIRTLYDLQQQQHQDETEIYSNNHHHDDVTNNYHEKWKLQIENVLRPLVRYCQYEMKDLVVNDDDKNFEDVLEFIDQNQQQRSTTAITTTKLLRFRNVDITFDRHTFSQQVTVAYLKIEPLLLLLLSTDHQNDGDDDDEVERTELRLMSDLDDLMVLVNKEYKMKYSTANNSTSQQQQQPQQQLFTTFYSYLKYYKLSIWRQRQETRIRDTLLKSDTNNNGNNNRNLIIPDMIHLYTTLQQIVTSMNELVPTTMLVISNTTGGLNNHSAVVNEDDPYTLEAQAHIVRVRAFRCYYMAQYYELVALSLFDDNNYRDDINQQQPMTGINSGSSRRMMQQQNTTTSAQLLLQQSQLLTKRAVEEMSAWEDGATLLLSSQLINTYLNELEQLNIQIKAMFCRMDATAYLQQQLFSAMKKSNSASSDNNNNTTKSGTASSTYFPLNPNRPLWMTYEEDVDDETKDGELTQRQQVMTLVDDPPLPIPLPCKGVFYDIARQYIDEMIHTEVIQTLSDHCATTSLDDGDTNNNNNNNNNDKPRGTSSIFNDSFLRWFSSGKK